MTGPGPERLKHYQCESILGATSKIKRIRTRYSVIVAPSDLNVFSTTSMAVIPRRVRFARANTLAAASSKLEGLDPMMSLILLTHMKLALSSVTDGPSVRFPREFAARNRKLARAACAAEFRCLDGNRVLCHTSVRSHPSYASIVPSRPPAQHQTSFFQGTYPPGLGRLDQRPSFLEWPSCRDRGRSLPRSERVPIDFECCALCPDRGLRDLCRLRP